MRRRPRLVIRLDPPRILGDSRRNIRNGIRAPNVNSAQSAPSCRQIWRRCVRQGARVSLRGGAAQLKHALNNLLFSTDRLPDDMFDGKRGLTLEAARLVSRERDYWDFDIIKCIVAATFGDQLHIDDQYFHPDAFGAEEFVERLKRPDSVGAVLHVRCMVPHLGRADHYVALVLRENGFDIIDSIPHTPDRELVRGETPRWPATIKAASW